MDPERNMNEIGSKSVTEKQSVVPSMSLMSITGRVHVTSVEQRLPERPVPANHWILILRLENQKKTDENTDKQPRKKKTHRTGQEVCRRAEDQLPCTENSISDHRNQPTIIGDNVVDTMKKLRYRRDITSRIRFPV
jgi:RNA 3'-terminal phosphate cyclase